MRELLTAGIAKHKFSLCFGQQWWRGGGGGEGEEKQQQQQWMEVRKAIIPDWNVTRMKRKLTMTVLRNDDKIKTLLNQFQWSWYILFRRQRFIWWRQNMLYFWNIKSTKIERSAFLGHPVKFMVILCAFELAQVPNISFMPLFLDFLSITRPIWSVKCRMTFHKIVIDYRDLTSSFYYYAGLDNYIGQQNELLK